MRRRLLPILGALASACATNAQVPTREANMPSAPNAAARTAEGDAFRSAAPPPEPKTATAPVRFESTTLPNGMGLVVAERHDLSVVTAALVTREGTADFPNDSPESIWTMLGTMTTDSTTANAHTPTDRMESIAAQLNWSAGP